MLLFSRDLSKPRELQKPFQAPQVLPDLHHTMPPMDVSYQLCHKS